MPFFLASSSARPAAALRDLVREAEDAKRGAENFEVAIHLGDHKDELLFINFARLVEIIHIKEFHRNFLCLRLIPSVRSAPDTHLLPERLAITGFEHFSDPSAHQQAVIDDRVDEKQYELIHGELLVAVQVVFLKLVGREEVNVELFSLFRAYGVTVPGLYNALHKLCTLLDLCAYFFRFLPM